MSRPDYLATQVLLLCDMTARYAHERDVNTNVVIDSQLRPAVFNRFRKAKRRANMATRGKA